MQLNVNEMTTIQNEMTEITKQVESICNMQVENITYYDIVCLQLHCYRLKLEKQISQLHTLLTEIDLLSYV